MTATQDWRDLCQQEKITPLKLVPFLPQDNNDDERREALRRATVELGKCLALPFSTFLSFVLEDSTLKNFVDTFLRFRRRHYEYPQLSDELPSPLPELGRRVFLVLLRAVGQEHASLPKEKKKPTPSSKQQTPGELLVAKGGMLAPPAVLDACALYGWSNPTLVVSLLRSLGELDGGAVGDRLLKDLEETGLASARALAEVHAKVAGASEGVGEESIGLAEASDLLSYVVDVSATIGSLLQVSSLSSVEVNGGSDRSDRQVSRSVAMLAFRLQGMDGEVSPEGLAAALALTFEATLPALEGLLLPKGNQAPPTTDPNFDVSIAVMSTKWRLSMARRWLLRCLHWLLGPVFLRPLGLQEEEPSAAEGGGIGDGSTAGSEAAVADGLFRFITSLAAASGHLAPPGHAGSLLGEYSRRFGLAEAIEQADAFAKLLRTPPKSSKELSMPVSASFSESGLDGERADYLAGVLRALPSVSENGMISREAGLSAEVKAGDTLDSSPGVSGHSGVGYGGPLQDPEEIEELIKSVQAVLGGVDNESGGGLGEGFVEACLSVLDWSPQAVIGAILEDRLPPQVTGLDRGLRRAWKGKKGDLDKAYRVDKELAASETKRLIAFERRQEDDAYLLSREYDDDYDDQYDDREVNVGAGMSSLGDLEAVRRVNQLLREEEEEEAWWEGAKNTNRSISAPQGSGSGKKWRTGAQDDEQNDQETAGDETENDHSGGRGRGRGGGRSGSVPGRGSGRTGGGGRGRGREAGGSSRGEGGGDGQGKAVERIQQRRKGAKKATVGNHNRKNAARKKESKGMF